MSGKELACRGWFIDPFFDATSAVSFATSFADSSDANESYLSNNKIIRCSSLTNEGDYNKFVGTNKLAWQSSAQNRFYTIASLRQGYGRQ